MRASGKLATVILDEVFLFICLFLSKHQKVKELNGINNF